MTDLQTLPCVWKKQTTLVHPVTSCSTTPSMPHQLYYQTTVALVFLRSSVGGVLVCGTERFFQSTQHYIQRSGRENGVGYTVERAGKVVRHQEVAAGYFGSEAPAALLRTRLPRLDRLLMHMPGGSACFQRSIAQASPPSIPCIQRCIDGCIARATRPWSWVY